MRFSYFHVRNLGTRAMLVAAVAAAGSFAWNCKSTSSPVESSPTDVTMAPPPAGQGFQIAIGPFDVPAGGEVQNNFYLKLPVDSDVYVTKVQFKFNSGSHHLNVFKSDTADLAVDATQPYASNVPYHLESNFNALQWSNWDMVCSSQVDSLTWTLPAGVGIHLNAHQQMDFQTHYVNASTQKTETGHGKIIVNFWTVPKSQVTDYAGAVFCQNPVVDLQPHTGASFIKVVHAWPNMANLMVMTGHFHSRGKKFVVGHVKWDGTKHYLTDTLYQNLTWDEPPVDIKTPPLMMMPGDSIGYVTTYENTTDNEIKFGGHVEIEEHANLFLYYYPAPPPGKAIYDFAKGEMLESHPL